MLPVLINPVAGPERAILRPLATTFRAAGVRWQPYLTETVGDAERLARELVAQGFQKLVVYGGDGTLKEVARALVNTEVTLAILPGGSGNAFARELKLPLRMTEAAALACGATPGVVRAVDMGEISAVSAGTPIVRHFILRASLGLETQLLQKADPALKKRFGVWAYLVSAARAWGQMPVTRYTLTFPDRVVTADGVQCAIANSAQMGLSGLVLANGARVDDGLLDVLVLTNADIYTLAELATTNWMHRDWQIDVQHWQTTEVTITAETPQAVALGGEVVAQTPVTVRILPGALKVLVPAQIGAPARPSASSKKQ